MNKRASTHYGSPVTESSAHAEYLDRLVQDIRAGNATLNEILNATSARLLHLINVRISPQLRTRVDPEDILQDTFVSVSKRFDEYLANPKVPVFVWLRGLAIERIIDANRFFLGAAKRNAQHEETVKKKWLDQSTFDILQNLHSNEKTPSQHVSDRQRSHDLKTAIQKLPNRYREVLVLRFFESLTINEMAAALDITVANAKVLQFRALQRLEEIIATELNWKSSDRIG